MIMADTLCRDMEGRWYTCNVSGIWQSFFEEVCCCRPWDSGDPLMLITLYFINWREKMQCPVMWCMLLVHNSQINALIWKIFCQKQKMDDELEFLILASDGLWDVVSNEVSMTFQIWCTYMLCFPLVSSIPVAIS